MKLISWNVNGLRACVGKGFLDFFNEVNADIFCIQETKLQEGQIDLELEGYHQYWNYAEKKGYSGTAVFTKVEPMSVSYGIDIEEHDNEGRVITLEYDEFYLVNVYTPNSQRELARLDYRMKWEDEFKSYLKKLEDKKPVILCGDLNVAHKEIDLKNPSTNRKNAGFTDEEREKMTALIKSGFVDTFRHFYPDKEDAYTWWSYMRQARDRNVGWRIDYFIVSETLLDNVKSAAIHSDVMGSDHCPVELIILKKIILRIIRLFIGYFVCAVGMVMTINANIGVSPWDVFHQGLGNIFNLPIGRASIIAGLIITIIDIFLGQNIGWGTIFNMIVIGIFVDFLMFNKLIPIFNSFFPSLLMMLLGMLVLGYGCYIYIGAGFGAGPRDGLMVALTKKTKRSVRFVKNSVEILATVVGYLLGGSVGIGTAIMSIAGGYFFPICFQNC